MSFLNLASGQLHRAAPFRSVAKRALFLAMLLLPGGLVVMPLVWWLDRARARGASPQPDEGREVTNEGQSNFPLAQSRGQGTGSGQSAGRRREASCSRV